MHLLDGEQDPHDVCARIGALIAAAPVDVAFVGIGENAHLAFNDPPADFDTREPYLVVSLDEACRRQQVGEGWFSEIESVPTQAISMSCRQILASRRILCIAPDARKAEAVRATVEGPGDTPRPCLHPADARRRDRSTWTWTRRRGCSSPDVPGVPVEADARSHRVRRPIRHLRWYIGGLLFLSTVINYIDRQTLSVLAPYLKTEFQLDEH